LFDPTQTFVLPGVGVDQEAVMCSHSVQILGGRVMRRRSFVALLGGGVLGAVLPSRIGAGELQTANRNEPITLSDYEFIPPAGWVVQRKPDHFLMRNPQSGCGIQIFEPRVIPASLEQVSRAALEQMYAGWQFRKTGEQQYLLSTGVLPKGLHYFMTEAEMSKEGGEFGGIMNGAALVVKAGSQIVIIGALHASLMPDHRGCWATYATWRRFFNSFTVRNTPTVRETEDELSRRIVGTWAMSGGLAVGEYVFRADGTYSSDGAFGTPDSGVSGVSGGGDYALAGDQLVMSTRAGTTKEVQLRFDRVNRGGTGWKDRLYMLKKDAHGEYEVSYEKR
jgi:hypothetical protein